MTTPAPGTETQQAEPAETAAAADAQQVQRTGEQSPAEAQAGGVPTPDVPAGDEPTGMQPGPGASDSPGQPDALKSHADAGTETADGVMPVATSNESAQLAVTPQAGAAKAHALLTHIRDVADRMIGDLERVVPGSMRQAASDETRRNIRNSL